MSLSVPLIFFLQWRQHICHVIFHIWGISCFVMWYINVIFIKCIKFTTYAIVLILKFSTGFSFMRYLIYEMWRDTYFDIIEDRMSEVLGTNCTVSCKSNCHTITTSSGSRGILTWVTLYVILLSDRVYNVTLYTLSDSWRTDILRI
jgi:hypothetical protein